MRESDKALVHPRDAEMILKGRSSWPADGYAPKAPAALIALILTTVIVAVFGLDQKGVNVLGAMPSGLPALTLPNVPLFDYLRLLPGALAVVGITLCEALLLATIDLLRRASRPGTWMLREAPDGSHFVPEEAAAE